MNVTNAAGKKTELSHAKLSTSSLKPGRWDDTLNAATAARSAAHASSRDANHATLSPAQKAQAHHDLNGKTGVSPTHRAGGAGEGHVRPARASKTTAPAAAIVEKGVHSPPDANVLQEKAQTLVNQFFMGSMLKQMRESPFKTETFSGGKAGDAYAGMFDSHIAEHAGNKLAKSLVKSMVRQYQKNALPLPTGRGQG